MSDSRFSMRVAAMAACAVTFGLAACSDSVVPTASPSASASRDAGGIPNGGNGNAFAYGHVKVCAAPPVGEASCHSWITIDDKGNPLVTSGPTGFNPADLQAAYNLTTGGTSVTVAIVDAYDDPNAESDLGVYRAKFGLPVCTTQNGCFRKINQNGGSTPPRANASWAEEISLDLDMVSAICPNCHILLVEASSNSFANLAAAVDQAAAQGAIAISNSYGGNEYAGEVSDESHFKHPGVAVTVSSGDNGFGVEFPAASQWVTAVGGTHLTHSGSVWTETVWSGAGSGCSAYITKPSWQHDACAKRTVADVSAVADPNTGVSVYDTYGLRPRGGWLVFGGTSVAAPIIGAVYALAKDLGQTSYGSLSYGAAAGSLFDVVSGSNGSCQGSYLCTAGAGYDGPTGNGSPRGTTAF
ncbi:MAG TPA: S53 family peptidase [Gemmatimonadaceae bacterium]|jgi:subtilase family serine protease|nr:S53 family peptidase [Gemmatimonadaceae bacterium]